MVKQTKTKFHRFKELLLGPLPLSALQKREGTVETTCTTNPSLTSSALPSGQGTTHPVFRWLPVSLRQRLHLRKLKEATKSTIEKESHLHLWCHLFDISNRYQFEVVQEYLKWLDSFREDNKIRIVPMEQLRDHV